ncbi:MAG: HAAS signaling domain-containing protein [Halanaerobiales bacterium]
MNKAVFMQELREKLKSLPENEIDDILYDYEEHFSVGIEKGKSEEEIAESLGNPAKIARSYQAKTVIENVNNNPTPRNIFKGLVAILSLGFFNLVFVLGPYIGLMGGLIALFAGAVAMIATGLAIIVAPIVDVILPVFVTINIPPIAAILLGIGITALGVLFFIFNLYIGRKIFNGTMKYVDWNIDIIKKGMVRDE